MFDSLINWVLTYPKRFIFFILLITLSAGCFVYKNISINTSNQHPNYMNDDVPINKYNNEIYQELDDNQKLMVQHLSDLNRKIDSATFNIQQLLFGRQAFVDALKASIDEAPTSEDSE